MKTNCTFLFILLAMIIANVCSAQPIVYLVSGANYSSLNFTLDDETNSYQKLGFTGGIRAGIPLNSKWSLETGLHYNTQGGENNAYLEYADGPYFVQTYATRNLEFNVLTIPILIKHSYEFKNSLIISGSIGEFISVGIGNIDYDVSTRREVLDIIDNDVNVEEDSYSESYEWKESGFDKFNCGLVFEVGLEYKRFLLSAFYNLGLSSLYNDEDYSVKGNTTGLTLAYRLTPNN